MGYQIRKLTRHYYAQFFKFAKNNEAKTDFSSEFIKAELKRIDAEFEQSSSSSLDGFFDSIEKTAPGGEEDKMQKEFFEGLTGSQSGNGKNKMKDSKAIIIGMDDDSGEIILSALLELNKIINGSHIAELTHIIAKENSYELKILTDFFGFIERYAGIKGVNQLKIGVHYNSPLIHYLSNNFKISSHGLHEGRIEIIFIKDLLLDFVGDARDWLSFCHWYIRLLFGHIADIPPIKLSDKNKSPYPIEFLIRSKNKDIKAHEIPVSVISINKQALVKLKTEKNITVDPKKYTLFLVETESLDYIPTEYSGYDQKITPQLLQTLISVKKNYLKHICEENQSLKSIRDSFIEMWCNLKSGSFSYKENDKIGAIVEIDRKTYDHLINKRLKNTSQQLLYFNVASFAEKMKVGDILFFFIWDNFTNKSSSSGVLCAYSTIAKCKKQNIVDIEAKWEHENNDGESYRSQAIFDEPFLNQYFQDEVIGFYLSDISYVSLGDKPEIIEGISYEELIDVFYSYFVPNKKISDAQKDFINNMFPVWGIGSTYLTKELVKELKTKFEDKMTTIKLGKQESTETKIIMTTDTEKFDVFLSHNSKDLDAVIQLKKILENKGVRCWLDDDELLYGDKAVEAINKAVRNSSCFITCYGLSGEGPWQNEEVAGAIGLAVSKQQRVIPLILPNAVGEPNFSIFESNRIWVNFRNGFADDKIVNKLVKSIKK